MAMLGLIFYATNNSSLLNRCHYNGKSSPPDYHNVFTEIAISSWTLLIEQFKIGNETDTDKCEVNKNAMQELKVTTSRLYLGQVQNLPSRDTLGTKRKCPYMTGVPSSEREKCYCSESPTNRVSITNRIN